MKIQLVSVPVPDPNEAIKFYTETLGFVTRLHMPEAYVAIVASSEDPDGTGLLLEPNQHPLSQAYQKGIRELGMPIIVFSVADLDAEYEKLTERGVHFTQPPKREEWGYAAIFDDTCGNLIQLAQA